jgi:predicted amidohydrolase YtcJ
MDGAVPVAEAVAVSGGRVSAIGSSEDVLALATRRTRLVDLQGRVAVPGLSDSHLHQFRAAVDRPRVALDGARSVADVVALVGARTARLPAGEWVEARTLWHESLLVESRLPTRWDLDVVSPDNPVYLPRGGHVATVNSAALERAGITRDTPDPAGGTIVRRADGEPTGVLLERARDLLSPVLPSEPTLQEQVRMLADQMSELNSMGVTSVTDPGLLPDELDAYLGLHEAGGITVRSHLLLRVHDLEALEVALAATSPRQGDALLRFDGFKYSIDGGVEGAALMEPYQVVDGEQTDATYRGQLILPPGGHDELAQMYLQAAEAGFQFQTHAVGDAAAEALLEHYEFVNSKVELRPLRWVAVHLSMPTRRVLGTMARLGILSTMQDNAVQLGRNQLRWWGEERAHAANPIRSVLDAGIVVGGGTDGPVVPLSPFLSLWWMTTRGSLQGDVIGAEHAISGEEALSLYTQHSAVTQFAEGDRGTLTAGKVADIAVLDDDPATMPVDRIKDLQCSMTLLGGRPVYERTCA